MEFCAGHELQQDTLLPRVAQRTSLDSESRKMLQNCVQTQVFGLAGSPIKVGQTSVNVIAVQRQLSLLIWNHQKPTNLTIMSFGLPQPFLPTLKVISEVGYAVSLLSLLVAFFILASIKRLRCPRNVLHMHLFASFIMRAAMSLLKDSLFVKGLGMMADLLTRDGDVVYFNSEHQVNWLCRMIVSLWQYFIMANYLWILMEGLYLHNLIFLALFSDSSSITLYVTLGWGVPAMFVLPWTVCRALWENNLCWTTNDITTIFLLIRVPTTTSIVVNFCLFMNIVRVLFLKLKSSACEETKTYRRWAKSTLVLVPLFGVHYMLFLGLHFSSNHTVEIVWLFCDQLFASFNGFFVALLYCFLNGEVKSELSKKWSVAELLEAAERWRCAAVGAGGATADDDEEGALANGSARDAACACVGDGHRKGKRGRRHRRPRGSCYSSTSFTTVSVLPPGHCCNPGKRRPQGSALSPSTPPPQPSPSPSRLAVQRRADAIDTAANSDTDSPEENDHPASLGKDRRWCESDYKLEQAIELRSITSSKSLGVKL